MVEPPAPPYIPAKYTGGHQSRLDRIVLHSTVSDTYCGGARAIARYFQDPTYVSSAHYVVDPCEEIQCVYDHTVAYHDGTNSNSIGVEMCDRPKRVAGRWQRSEHKQMLNRTALLVRQLCLAYDIPIRKLSPAQIRAGWKGICGHDDMANAFPGSTTHWDPGSFPWSRFIRLTQVTSQPVRTGPTFSPEDTMISLPYFEFTNGWGVVNLIPPDDGFNLCIGTSGSALEIHHIKLMKGDGRGRGKVEWSGTVPAADPWWQLEIPNGTIQVEISYTIPDGAKNQVPVAGFRIQK